MYAMYEITSGPYLTFSLRKTVTKICIKCFYVPNSTGGKSINKKTGSSQNESFCRKDKVTL